MRLSDVRKEIDNAIEMLGDTEVFGPDGEDFLAMSAFSGKVEPWVVIMRMVKLDPEHELVFSDEDEAPQKKAPEDVEIFKGEL